MRPSDGVDIDLLTRGAGFGYIGSTITSLIYASFTFIFFAIEAVILASVLEICFGIPLRDRLSDLRASSIIPLVTHGITLISRFQLWTQPVWLVLQRRCRSPRSPARDRDCVRATGRTSPAQHGDRDGRFDLLLFGAAASVVFSLIAQIGEQVDFLRFLPPRPRGSAQTAWWIGAARGRPGLDRARRAEAAGRIVPGLLRRCSHGVAAEHAARAGADVSRGLSATCCRIADGWRWP